MRLFYFKRGTDLYTTDPELSEGTIHLGGWGMQVWGPWYDLHEEGVIIRPFIGYFPSIKPPQHGVQNSTDPTAAERTDTEIPEVVEPIENKDNQEVNDLIQLTQSGSRTDIQEWTMKAIYQK